MIFFLISTKYSTHHSLSANTGFKFLAFILFEILHLQNCDVKFLNILRAITQKKNLQKNSPDNLLYQLLKFLASNTYTFRDIAFAISKIYKRQ